MMETRAFSQVRDGSLPQVYYFCQCCIFTVQQYAYNKVGVL